MKRGSLLLVFALSVVFSISVFSFLLMVSADDINPCELIKNDKVVFSTSCI